MNKIIASAAVALALAAGATTASADRYGYGYGNNGYGYNSRPATPSEAFARQAARDGYISRDEARIINNLRAREAYGPAPYHHHRPWYRRWW